MGSPYSADTGSWIYHRDGSDSSGSCSRISRRKSPRPYYAHTSDDDEFRRDYTRYDSDRGERGYYVDESNASSSDSRDRRHHSYNSFTYDRLEAAGLSKTYAMQKPASRWVATGEDEDTIHAEWETFSADWEDGIPSLRVVHASEYSVYKDGRERIKLVCPARTDRVAGRSPAIQMKWLHLQRHCLRLDILKKLVVKSPFISQELKTVALSGLEDVEKSYLNEPENMSGFNRIAGSSHILRYIGRYDEDGGLETQSVIFLSSPYLALMKSSSLSGLDKGHHMATLLQSLYGFDFGDEQHDSEVLRKMGIGSLEDALHVPQLWSLLVGSDLLITFSELSSAELCGDLVKTDLKASPLGRPLTVRVVDAKMRRYSIVIEGNSNYVDFLRDAVALARQPGSDATDYELLDSEKSGTTITPQRWLKLLESGDIENTTFYVIQKTGRRRYRRDQSPSPVRVRTVAVRRREPSRERPARKPVRSSAYGAYGPQPADIPHREGEDPGPSRTKTDDRVMVTTTGDGSHPNTQLIRWLGSHPKNDRSERDLAGKMARRGDRRQTGQPRELVPRSRPVPMDDRVINDVTSGAKVPEIFSIYRNDNQGSQPETKGPPHPNSTSETLSQSSVSTRSSGRSDHSSTSSNDGEVHTLPHTWWSIRALQDLGISFTEQDQLGEITVVQALSRTLRDELLNLSEAYRRYSDPPSSGIRKQPFFTWTYKVDRDGANILDSDVATIQILNRLHEQVSDGRTRRLYNAVFPCTREDLFRRHSHLEDHPGTEQLLQDEGNIRGNAMKEQVMEQPSPQRNSTGTGHGPTAPRQDLPTAPKAKDAMTGRGSVAEGNSNSNQSPRSPILPRPVEVVDVGEDRLSPDTQTLKPRPPPDEGESPIREQKAPLRRPETTGDDTEQPQHRRSLEMSNRHRVVVRRLVEVSEDVLSDFLPRAGSALVHQISKKFWGSLDDMLRQAAWSAVDASQPPKWTIRNFPPPTVVPSSPSLGKAFSECEACQSRAQYDSHSEALLHLHSDHMQCTHSDGDQRPSDDPCFVWLKASEEVEPALIWEVERFIDSLLSIKKLTHELHCLVAVPSTSSGHLVDAKLSLPKNLFDAFEEIISMYLLMSKQLSMTNKADSEARRQKTRHNPYSKVSKMQTRGLDAFENARRHLEASSTDLILLGTTPRNFDIFGLDAIGPEFLMAAFAINLQNRPILSATATGNTWTIEVYQRYISKLRYQASRRPQRRIFLDIHRLEVELEALAQVVQSQSSLLHNYLALLSPDSYRVTTRTREDLFDAELRYINMQIGRLFNHSKEIHVLQWKAKTLKEQVKQAIEILEEGHGKAIRVFTIVTLFFLPLSFTSSFFGMNTTDVRDTGHDQRIFWAVSIPVTMGVFTLAWIYGYKGDAIRDSISAALRPRKQRAETMLRAGENTKEQHPRRVVTGLSMMSAMEGDPFEQSRPRRLRSWFHSGKIPRWNRRDDAADGKQGGGNQV